MTIYFLIYIFTLEIKLLKTYLHKIHLWLTLCSHLQATKEALSSQHELVWCNNIKVELEDFGKSKKSHIEFRKSLQVLAIILNGSLQQLRTGVYISWLSLESNICEVHKYFLKFQHALSQLELNSSLCVRRRFSDIIDRGLISHREKCK